MTLLMYTDAVSEIMAFHLPCAIRDVVKTPIVSDSLFPDFCNICRFTTLNIITSLEHKLQHLSSRN